MIIRRPNSSDWETFSTLAETEGWQVPHAEMQLFQGSWSQSAYVLDNGGFCGLVTAVAYENSAWIGNLIVPEYLRGKGYGSYLFKVVFTELKAKGVSTVWLTASELGRSIYERHGFVAVDHVERWILPIQQQATKQKDLLPHDSFEALMHTDVQVWGESRIALLSELYKTGNGAIFSDDNSIALLQRGPDKQIVGPWYLLDADVHPDRKFLQSMVAASSSSVELIIDCLSSAQIQPLFQSAGFYCTGKTVLMAYGDIADVKLNRLLTFASLGSIG